ncbi:MAG: membrane protein insertion efficiency factor YidD [bacterium]|nr:membrane protein insertion efficiency factor YidD [bacterium]
MKHALIFLIRGYQRFFSLETGFLPRALGMARRTCAFYPSCSAYAIEAIERRGALLGTLAAAHRLARCHPWQKPQVDIVE